MRKTSLCLLSFLVYLTTHAQFPIHQLLPMGVDGILFGDSIINTATVLRGEKIKKVIADQTTGKGKSKLYYRFEYTIANGLIKSNQWCLNRLSGSEICALDTLIYDANGRLLEFSEMNGGGTTFIQEKLAYGSEGKVTSTWIYKSANKASADTDIYTCHYNQAGQLTRKEKGTTQYKANGATLFYNQDGLIESIHHDDPALGIFLFKRNQKGNKKEIRLTTGNGSYKWIYNSDGQCLSSEYDSRPFPKAKSAPPKSLFHKASYSYNPDGTISKIVEKAAKKRVITTLYTYVK